MPFLALEVIQRAGDLLDGRPQPVEQAQARIGERDASGPPMQQADPEMLLELPHRVAECGGCDTETRGCRAKAQIIGDGNERGQSGEIGAAHC